MRYVLVDRITDLQPGRLVHAVKNVSISDDLATSYRPGLAGLPSAFVLEALAQAAGVLLAATTDCCAQPVLAKVQPFVAHALARPGDQIALHARVEDLRPEGCRARVTADVDGRPLAEGTVHLALVPFDTANVAAHRRRLRMFLADLYPEWFVGQ